MKQYMLSVYHHETYAPPPDVAGKIQADVSALNLEMQAAGAWVFAGGLNPASTATVLRAAGDDVLITDGPFAEGKEHVGGLWVIRAPDLDAALEWGGKATRACQVSARACAAGSPARTRSRRRSAPCTPTRRWPPLPTGHRSCSFTTSSWRSRPVRW